MCIFAGGVSLVVVAGWWYTCWYGCWEKKTKENGDLCQVRRSPYEAFSARFL